MKVEEVKKETMLKDDELKQIYNRNQNDSFQFKEVEHSAGSTHGIESATVSIPEFCDQRFSHPQVLVHLPHRHSALRFV